LCLFQHVIQTSHFSNTTPWLKTENDNTSHAALSTRNTSRGTYSTILNIVKLNCTQFFAFELLFTQEFWGLTAPGQVLWSERNFERSKQLARAK